SFMVSDLQLTSEETSMVTITFSEAVTGLTAADFTVANGTLSGLSTADGGITWTATLTPDIGVEDPTNVITLDNTGYQDAAGNEGTGTTDSNNYAVDTQRPTATITVADTQLTVGETTIVTIAFSEAVTGLSLGDFIVSNGLLGSLSTEDNMTYTAILTPLPNTEDATNVIRLDNAGFRDLAGNSGSGTTDSNNYLVDTQPPLVNTQNITIQLDGTGNVSIQANQVDDNSTDGFGIANLMIDQTDFDCTNVGPNTVILTVTDVNGNTATGTATVTVEDTTAPTVTTRNLTVQLDATGNASITAAQLNNGSTDACGIQSITASKTSFDCSNVGPNIVTLTVTDVNGNTATGTATVTVEDNTAPVVNTQNITVQLDATGNASITADQLNNGSTDSCGIQSITASKTTFDCTNVGTNTVTLTVTDVNGNQATGTATVTVEDNTAPTVTTRNLTIQLDATGNASITADQLNNGSTDACGIQSITASKTTFDCTNVGPNTVTLTVTDVNGNTATGTAIVTVEDTTAPIVQTRSITIQLDATGNASIMAAQLDNGSTDACGIQSITASKTTFDCTNVGPNTVTLTVTDVNGNTATGTAIVTVEDNIAPVVNTRNLTVQLDATGNASITAEQINNGSTDACGIQSITASKTSFDCTNVGPNTVTLTVTDVNGNTATGTATVTVEDTTAPIVQTRNLTIQLDATGNASITAEQINNGSTDACGIQSITASKIAFDCSNVGPNNVTLTVTDVNGNTATGTATVTVEDKLAPVPSQSQLPVITAVCSLDTLTPPRATDNCQGTLVATTATVLPISESTVVTWVFTDPSGNRTQQTQEVRIVDGTSPEIREVPEDFEVILYSDRPYVLADFTQIAKASDNCKLVSFSQTPQAGTVYSQPGEVVVTLTARDSFDNETKVSFTITLSNRLIIGLVNPEMITVPWNTPPAAISLPASVRVTLSNGEQAALPVTWNTAGYNPLLSAVYPLTGTLQLGDIENPDNFSPTQLILVQDKLPPTDILLSNNEFGANTSTNQSIGVLTTVDAQDNIHTYGLVNVQGNDGQYFRVEGNQLYLNTEDPLPGKTLFTIVVRSTDRVGNSIERTFVLNRTRIPVNEVEIFNSFTP
ncbi:Ig-like domain-containing protein, partial [Algoriphagus sp. AK58]|uniref:Ig-like domain-containing protein n=1 Tax=Algoriphagus sp. AK58 TaxID=1406877 RepID=UPI0016501303